MLLSDHLVKDTRPGSISWVKGNIAEGTWFDELDDIGEKLTDIEETLVDNVTAKLSTGVLDPAGVKIFAENLKDKSWHSPGLGEVHRDDHKQIIYCMKETDDQDASEIIDEELAELVCESLNFFIGETINRYLENGYKNPAP